MGSARGRIGGGLRKALREKSADQMPADGSAIYNSAMNMSGGAGRDSGSGSMGPHHETPVL